MNWRKYRNDIISIAVTIILGIIIVLLAGSIFKSGFVTDKIASDVQYYEGKVTQVVNEKLQSDKYIDNVKLGYQEVTVEIIEGPYEGEKLQITNNISRLYNTITKKGSKIIVALHEEDGEIADVYISSFKRSHILLILALMFLGSILLVGGFKGLKSIVSLVFTMVCVIYLMLPLMLKGISPIISAILIAILSITVTLLLVSGRNKKTLSAILGTIMGVIVAGTLAYVFGRLTNLSGINMSDAESVMYVAETTDLKVTGLMFAGILVSALGAVMDVAMSISSSMFEIKSLNSKITGKELIKSGMNIGKDIIGTMSNTLILAFAGGSIDTLILIYSANMPSNRLFNLDIIGTEVIQGLAGSIGIILTVPLTVLISSYLYKTHSSK